ncbi:LysR family transcriptional regulator [Brevibacillus sp. NRS-1366]|uniref:LysR family transcriptional regulator n=1 Tax=Brevibacillus sp. NRS-1366 TaxID=3233899 RepID=UPI003D246BD7
MDVKQLRYFIAIAEEKKISAAAKRLHMAQPPLSQQLKNLEQDLGVPLVIRHQKGLDLTEAGVNLYKHALKIVKYMDESRLEVKEIGDGTRGKLSLGVNTLSSDLLADELRKYKERYPHITYKIQQNESAQLCKMVKERVIELAIVRFPLELDDFSILHLKSEPFYFVSSTQEERCAAVIRFEEMQAYPLILPSTEGLGVYHMILEEFSRRNLEVKFLSECSDIPMLLELVSSGFGATIVPEVVLKMHKGHELSVIKIEETNLSGASGIIWLKDHYLSMAARHFIEQIKDSILPFTK